MYITWHMSQCYYIAPGQEVFREIEPTHTYILDTDVEMIRRLLWKLVHTMIETETSNDVICEQRNTRDQ